MNKYIAFVLTKYQFNVLLAALYKLNIDKKDVFLIIAEKARKQGVNGEGFYNLIVYEESDSVKNWKKIKNKNKEIMKQIDFIPKGIFLRNFNATISRTLISNFYNSTLYLLEEGMDSYMKNNFLGLPNSYKEIVKTILSRIYFSKGKLKFLPVNKNNTYKVGLFEGMKPWLKVPFIKIDLSILFEKSNKKLKYDVLILDQPLWQIGLNEDEIKQIYNKLIMYVKKYNYKNVAIKLHPSTNKKKFEEFLKNNGILDIEIINSTKNIEEMLFSDELSEIKIFIGFFSWSLCLIKKYYLNEKEVVSIINKKLINETKDVQLIMKKCGIKIIKGDKYEN